MPQNWHNSAGTKEREKEIHWQPEWEDLFPVGWQVVLQRARLGMKSDTGKADLEDAQIAGPAGRVRVNLSQPD